MSDIMSEVKECSPPFNFNPDLSKIQSPFVAPPEPVYRNPNEGLEKLVSEQTTEIEKIRYENMKLNAQIEVLNKAIDSQDGKLDKLRETNAELEASNRSLQKLVNAHKHQMISGIIMSVSATLIAEILIMYITSLF